MTASEYFWRQLFRAMTNLFEADLTGREFMNEVQKQAQSAPATELGDRLRSMACLADENPHWTGVIVLAHRDTVTMHMSCTDENGELAAQVLTAGLSAMVGPGMLTRESPFADRVD